MNSPALEITSAHRLAQNSWPLALPIALATGGKPQESILAAYGVDEADFLKYYNHPTFRQEIMDAQRMIAAGGVSFQKKAQIQAEEYLLNIDDVVNDDDTDPGTKIRAIENVVRWAGYDQKGKGNDSETVAAPTVNVQINLTS